MAQLNMNQYKPKYGQDPQMFNQMYMNYIDQLNNTDTIDSEPDTPVLSTQSSRPQSFLSQQSSQIADEDRDGQNDYEDQGESPKINFMPS